MILFLIFLLMVQSELATSAPERHLNVNGCAREEADR